MQKTRYPGVHRRPDGRYRIRVKAMDPRTERVMIVKRIVEASSASEAATMREQARLEIEVGARREVARVRLGDAATSWLRGKLPALKASTRSRYASVIDLHIAPKLGDIFLDALTASDIIAWRDGQKGKPASVNARLRVLNTILADVCDEHGTRNPATRVESLRERRGKRKGMTAAELATFLDKALEVEPSWYPMLLTLALTGARFGEVSALRWEHIDFQANTIRIEEAQWLQIVDETKTGARLELPLLPELADVLKAHRRQQVADQVKGLERGLVFPSPRAGRYLYGSVLRKPIDRIVEAIELDGARARGEQELDPERERKQRPSVHGFRHTFNNLCRQVAAGEVVRAMVGHVTEAMTDRYSHVEDEEKRRAAEDVFRMVANAKVKK